MPDSLFPYPGGKHYMVNWILDYLPDHLCYVEPFCGSASVFLNKESSYQAVLNDINHDIVQFFDVYRDRTDELVRWLQKVPYSRELHSRWKDQYFEGERPEEPIERAGRFFFLRYSQFSAKIKTHSGFSSTTGVHSGNRAQRFANAREKLKDFSDCFDHVVVENKGYKSIIEKYDAEETLFYLDPPYIEEGDALYDGYVDHSVLADTLDDCVGQWIISYTDVPESLSGYQSVEKDVSQMMGRGNNEDPGTRTESLVMNFDPDTVKPHTVSNSASEVSW